MIFEKNDGIWLQYTDLYPSIKMVYEWEKSDGKSREMMGDSWRNHGKMVMNQWICGYPLVN